MITRTYGNCGRFHIQKAPGGMWLVHSPVSEPADMAVLHSFDAARHHVAARLAEIADRRKWEKLTGVHVPWWQR